MTPPSRTVTLCGFTSCCPTCKIDGDQFRITDDFGNVETLTRKEAGILSLMEGNQIAFRSLRMNGEHAAALRQYI